MENILVVSLGLALAAISLYSFLRFVRIGGRVTELNVSISGRTPYRRKKGGGDVDVGCAICLGGFEEGDAIVNECVCGKVSHLSCSEPTGECPYCHRPHDSGRNRARKVLECPVCGERVDGNVCACKTVILGQDGTFDCLCGNLLRESSGVCPECGRTYSMKSLRGAHGPKKTV